MANIEMAKLSLLTAPSKPIGHITDKVPAMEIWYDGSPIDGTATTAATIQYATATLTCSINGSGDSRIGSSGAMLCSGAAYDTAIEVERVINAVPGWNCRLLGVLGAASMNATMEDSGAALNCLRTAAQVKVDTSALLTQSWCITNASDPVFSSGSSIVDKRSSVYDERGAVNCLFYLYYTVTLGGASTLKVYSIDRRTETENLLGTFVPAATTVANTFDFTDQPITARHGEQLVIIHTDDTSLSCEESIINAKSIRM